jgi:hypothetical protein
VTGLPAPWLLVDAPGEEVPVVLSPAEGSVLEGSVVGSEVCEGSVVGSEVCEGSDPGVEDEPSGGVSSSDAGGSAGVSSVGSVGGCPPSALPDGSVCDPSDPSGVVESFPSDVVGSVVVWLSPESLGASDVEASPALSVVVDASEESGASVESVVASSWVVDIFVPSVGARWLLSRCLGRDSGMHTIPAGAPNHTSSRLLDFTGPTAHVFE